MCGEQLPSSGGDGGHTGSSPRVRGTGQSRRLSYVLYRFIPACAGNSSPPRPSRRPPAVHPRVCGEQTRKSGHFFRANGSSPRVRGTVALVPAHLFLGRFIPACAGNSRPAPASSPPPPVHPRVCGEQAVGKFGANEAYGSSPRVRGTDSPRRQKAVPPRFIPACAGNRRRRAVKICCTTVHPRVCGEQFVFNKVLITSFGSSPRVRGTGA